MTSISGSMRNLMGGINQQPREIRPLNSMEDIINGLPSVVTGLKKRSGSELINVLMSSGAPSDAAAFVFERADKDPKLIVSYGGDLRIFDLETGTEEVVNFDTSATDYIQSSAPSKDIGFQEVGDTVFIYNKTKTVTASSVSEDGSRLNPMLYGTAWVRQQALGANYNIYIDKTLKATVVDTSTPTMGTDAFASDLRTDLEAEGFTVYQNGSVLTVVLTSTQLLTHTDGYGDQAIRSYNEIIERFSDLPPNEVVGRLVQVRGELEDQADGFYTRFDEDGIWQEECGWNAGEELDATTMPHILFDNGDGTWDLTVHEWDQREAGDADSNPTPSFVGYKISYLFIYKGRMCVLADENFVASQKNNFENFYRSTTTQLLDDDRIDIASSEGYARLAYAVEFNEKLMIFADKDQFFLKSENFLSPNDVKLERTTGYEIDRYCLPGKINNNVAFVESGDRYATVREYFVKEGSQVQDAERISSQIPTLIPTGAYRLLSSTSESKLGLLTKGDRSQLFFYSYFYTSEGRVLSAWVRWKYPDCEIVSGSLLRTVMYLLIKHDDQLLLVKIKIAETGGQSFGEDLVHMDLKVHSDDLTITYADEASRLTMPYTTTQSSKYRLVVLDDPSGELAPGEVYEPTTVSGTDLTFDYVNLSGVEFQIGLVFEFYFKLNPFYVRDKEQVAIQDGRLQLRYLSFLYSSTAYFEVHSKPPGRDVSISKFTGDILGDADNVLGQLILDSGEKRVPIFAEAEKVDIWVRDDSPYPSQFSSIEWSGIYRAKSQRI